VQTAEGRISKRRMSFRNSGEGIGVRYANRYLGSLSIFVLRTKTYKQITLISCERNDAEGSVDNSVFFFSVHFSFYVTIKKKSEQNIGTFQYTHVANTFFRI
ncbi:hypothetical protein IJ596_04855, partial [bacterium]|nr:hypothetical protein [bacterium]